MKYSLLPASSWATGDSSRAAARASGWAPGEAAREEAAGW
jgi:hypothetical protein